MSLTTLSSREFNQDASRAKAASLNGPVIITDRGRPAHVLLSISDYKKLTGKRDNIVDLLAAPQTVDIDFLPPKNKSLAKAADLR